MYSRLHRSPWPWRNCLGSICVRGGTAIFIQTELPCMDIVIPDGTSIGVFAVAAILLLLTPGPAVLYIIARSVEQGPRRRLGFGLRHHNSNTRTCAGGGAGSVSAAGLLGAFLRGRQICGRWLSDLYRGGFSAGLRPRRWSCRGVVWLQGEIEQLLGGTGSIVGAPCHITGSRTAVGVSRNLGWHSRNSVSRRPSSTAHRT
jgi:hypothetical protein